KRSKRWRCVTSKPLRPSDPELSDHSLSIPKLGKLRKTDPRQRISNGDCLERVPELVRRFGSAQLIYVDPPFNAGGLRKARQDKGHRAEGTDAYVDFWGGLDGFMEMIRTRLEVLRDALAADGSLWLQLDHRAIHDVKVALDDV